MGPMKLLRHILIMNHYPQNNFINKISAQVSFHKRVKTLDPGKPENLWEKKKIQLTLQINIKQVSCNAFNCIIYGKYMHALLIFHILTLMHTYHIPEPHSKVWPNNLIHPDLRFITSVISKRNTNCISSLLPLKSLPTKTRKHLLSQLRKWTH